MLEKQMKAFKWLVIQGITCDVRIVEEHRGESHRRVNSHMRLAACVWKGTANGISVEGIPKTFLRVCDNIKDSEWKMTMISHL